jgi:two-component system cell cycle response regulator DivK
MPQALIIDDNGQNVQVLVNLLSDEGLDSLQVTNPKQLNSVLQSLGKIEIVFLDLEMPGLTGYEILEMLKLDDRFAGVPIVAYTVYSNEINRAYELGFDSFIGKPLDPDKFPDQLAKILSGEAVWVAG